jgi:hypothetical protein
MKFFPQTRFGKWAAGVILLWPLLTIVGFLLANNLYIGVDAGNGLIDDLRVRPMLAVTMLLGITFGIISFGLSIAAITKQKERSITSFIAALIGLFLITLLVGEIFIQH